MRRLSSIFRFDVFKASLEHVVSYAHAFFYGQPCTLIARAAEEGTYPKLLLVQQCHLLVFAIEVGRQPHALSMFSIGLGCWLSLPPVLLPPPCCPLGSMARPTLMVRRGSQQPLARRQTPPIASHENAYGKTKTAMDCETGL